MEQQNVRHAKEMAALQLKLTRAKAEKAALIAQNCANESEPQSTKPAEGLELTASDLAQKLLDGPFLKCHICWDTLVEPVMLTCGHHYC